MLTLKEMLERLSETSRLYSKRISVRAPLSVTTIVTASSSLSIQTGVLKRTILHVPRKMSLACSVWLAIRGEQESHQGISSRILRV